MSRLRIGTCSWRFPSWAGIVYSAPEGIDHLAEYARPHDTVEVGRWFWSLFGDGEPRLPEPATHTGVEERTHRRSPDTTQREGDAQWPRRRKTRDYPPS